MLPHLRLQLLAMRAHDEDVRARLAADGSLFDGYHHRMEQVHRDNADALRAIIKAHGWPVAALAGVDGAEAAWLVAQHAIGEPAFMRQCRQLLDDASRDGRVPRWQYAYIDDRIRVFEGKPQRFGTQFDMKPDGVALHELEDASLVDAWRQEAGLGPLAAALPRSTDSPLPSAEEHSKKQAAALEWRRSVGWVS